MHKGQTKDTYTRNFAQRYKIQKTIIIVPVVGSCVGSAVGSEAGYVVRCGVCDGDG